MKVLYVLPVIVDEDDPGSGEEELLTALNETAAFQLITPGGPTKVLRWRIDTYPKVTLTVKLPRTQLVDVPGSVTGEGVGGRG